MPCQLELFLIRAEKTWNENKLERREDGGPTEPECVPGEHNERHISLSAGNKLRKHKERERERERREEY